MYGVPSPCSPPSPERGREELRPCDALALGLAQAAALVPGISRSGAVLTAARARGFGRAAAQALSRHAALPVIAGAAALKGVRIARAGLACEQRALLAMGCASAFVSTLASARLLWRSGLDARPLWPYALYRAALAGVALGRGARLRAQ